MDINLQFQHLPSPPGNILKLGSALLNSDKNQKLNIEKAISSDPVISLRILELAKINSGKVANNIAEALTLLDEDTLIYCVCEFGFSSHNSLNQTTESLALLSDNAKQSLACGLYAGLIAKITGYYDIKNAYLCGLVSQIGKRYLLCHLHDKYQAIYTDKSSSNEEKLNQEKKLIGFDSNEICAKIVAPLSPHPWFVDAIKFQDHNHLQLSHSHHLCKIIALAKSLSSGSNNESREIAKHLFDLDEQLINEITQSVEQQVSNQVSFQEDINDKLEIQSELNTCLCELNQLRFQEPNNEWQKDVISIGNYLKKQLQIKLNINDALLFSKLDNSHSLNAYIHSDNIEAPDFKLSIENRKSCCVNAWTEKKLTTLKHNDNIDCLSDQQLLNYFKTRNIVFLPLESNNKCLGVVAIGLNAMQLNSIENITKKTQRLLKTAANALKNSSLKKDTIFSNDNERFEKLIGEVLHETSNPLAIIKNYLNLIHNKEDNSNENHQEIALIEQEVERVSLILNKLRHPDEAKALIDRQDINRLVMDTAAIFKQTYCAPKRIHLTVVTDPQLSHEVIDETAFKQTLTNILKNACEALDANEEIRIFTHSLVHLNEKSYFGVTISDNGPGLPDEIRNHLFTPYHSTKGDERGLGLSIVKDIMHKMNGKIVCHSNSDDRVATGTRFQLLFPREQN